MVALSDNMVALSDSVVPMILHVNSQCVQCELFCQDSCVGCSPVRLCFVWGNGALPWASNNWWGNGVQYGHQGQLEEGRLHWQGPTPQ